MRKVRNGLTLIELLLILVIITIIAALCVPVFSQSRVNLPSCEYNEKQIATAMAVYRQDYDERWIDLYPNYNERNPTRAAYPANGPQWATSKNAPATHYLLEFYIPTSAVFNCPIQTIKIDTNTGVKALYPVYALNELIFDGPNSIYNVTHNPAYSPPDYKDTNRQWSLTGPYGRLNSQLTHPATTINLWEHNFAAIYCNTWSLDATHWNVGHNGGFNATFADGHVKPWSLAKLTNQLVCYWNLP